jgi:hypothetical protein
MTMIANRMLRSFLLSVLLLAATAICSPPVYAQKARRPIRERQFGGALVIDAEERTGGDDSDFARWAFGKGWDPAAVRLRLDTLLERKVRAIDEICDLTEAQKQKLHLAGRGDINRLFERIEGVRRDFELANNDETKVIALLPAIQALQRSVGSRLFEDGSLFAKTFAGMLTDRQTVQLRERRARAGSTRISVDNAGMMQRIAEVQKDASKIVWSRDAKQIAFVMFDKSVEICEATEYRLIRTVGDGMRPVDFSPAPETVAIAENSSNATIVDLATGRKTQLPTGNPQPAVKFSPDGKTLVTGGYGNGAKLWSAASGELLREFDIGHVTGGLTPEFSPDGKVLAIGNRNSVTNLFDTSSGRPLHVLAKSHSQGMKFAPSGKMLAVVYVDATLALWDAETGRLIRSAKAPADELYTVDWSPDGSLLVTAGNDSHVTFWNPSELSILNELESPEWVISAKFSPDGTKLLFSGGIRQRSADRRVEIWGAP